MHPGIDVHFDIVFLNDHCGIILHDGVFKLFVNVDRKYGFIFNGFVSMETFLTFDIKIIVKTTKILTSSTVNFFLYVLYFYLKVMHG